MNEDSKQPNGLSDYLQNVLDNFSKAKNEYSSYKDECMRLRESNGRLLIEVQEARELEKSHRYHLSTSREIISNLQESVSNLVPHKREIKKLTAELEARDKIIATTDEEINKLKRVHNEELLARTLTLEQNMDQICLERDAKLASMEQECDTRSAQEICRAAELASRVAELEVEHKEKINMVVLEYEERLQRANSQLTQLRDQHAGLAARSEANLDVYRRRVEDLEEKLKQSEFKKFLSSSSALSQLPTPYDPHPTQPEPEVIELVSDFPRPMKQFPPSVPQRRPSRPTNPLNVVQIPCADNRQSKKTFNISKKRKLYTEKDFH